MNFFWLNCYCVWPFLDSFHRFVKVGIFCFDFRQYKKIEKGQKIVISDNQCDMFYNFL